MYFAFSDIVSFNSDKILSCSDFDTVILSEVLNTLIKFSLSFSLNPSTIGILFNIFAKFTFLIFEISKGSINLPSEPSLFIKPMTNLLSEIIKPRALFSTNLNGEKITFG